MTGQPDKNRWDLGHETGYRQGYEKGRADMRKEVLDYLEERYLEEGGPRVPGGKAVLRIAREVATFTHPSNKGRTE